MDYENLTREEHTDLWELELKIKDSITAVKNLHFSELAIIDGKYSFKMRELAAKKYKEENGWPFAYHKTTTEAWEPHDRTYFRFSNTELDNTIVHNYNKVC